MVGEGEGGVPWLALGINVAINAVIHVQFLSCQNGELFQGRDNGVT